jgi:hypothetical protein
MNSLDPSDIQTKATDPRSETELISRKCSILMKKSTDAGDKVRTPKKRPSSFLNW